MLSRATLAKDWKLHSEVVAQIWGRYDKAKVDLFVSVPSVLLPYEPERSDGVGCLGT